MTGGGVCAVTARPPSGWSARGERKAVSMTTTTQLALVLLVGLAIAALARLRPSWLSGLGLLKGPVCPVCRRGVLRTAATWSWTRSEDGRLVVLKHGANEPSLRQRTKMEEEFPERAAETFLRCPSSRCESKFVRRVAHPSAGATSWVLEPCSEDEWRQVVES
jgi:hypothetical protein